MKRYLILTILTLTLVACTKQNDNKQATSQGSDNASVVVDNTWTDDADTIYY